MQSGPRGFNASTNLYREAPARTSRAARGEPLLVEAVEEVEQPQAPPSILVHRKRICSHVLVVAVCDFAVTDLAAGSRGSTMPTPRHDGRDRDVELEPAAPVARLRGLIVAGQPVAAELGRRGPWRRLWRRGQRWRWR